MPDLRAYMEAQRHRHEWVPLPPPEGDVTLERCECGALRPAPEPDTD